MNDIYKQIKQMTIEEFLETFLEGFIVYKEKQDRTKQIYKAIFNYPIDYKTLHKLIPYYDEQDISFILKYDKDYSISFLLSISDIADEDDMTKQAIYLFNRHNLNYILPLLPFVNEQDLKDYIDQNNYKKDNV